MSKVIGVHLVDLKPGVSAEEFERFLIEEYAPGVSQMPGTKMLHYKGSRGDEVGTYALLFEFESRERWEELFPAHDEPSQEVMQWIADNQALWDKRNSLCKRRTYTDFVELGS